jgi:hypothetical protein
MMKKLALIRYGYIILAVFSLLGCGSDSSISRVSMGSISAKIVWGQRIANSPDRSAASVPSGVVTVRIIVSGPDINDIQKDFPASAGEGIIDGVPVGTSRTVTVQGLDSSGIPNYQGSKTNVAVNAGQTTDVGIITLTPTPTPGPTPTPASITLPSGSLYEVPAGDYTITINVCAAGFCQTATSFPQSNIDSNNFAQSIVDSLNTYFTQQFSTDCSQSGCSCPVPAVNYMPWDGTSFTISVDLSITCGADTTSAMIQFVGTKM